MKLRLFTRYCGAKAWYVLVPKGVTSPRDAIMAFIAVAASYESTNKQITCSPISRLFLILSLALSPSFLRKFSWNLLIISQFYSSVILRWLIHKFQTLRSSMWCRVVWWLGLLTFRWLSYKFYPEERSSIFIRNTGTYVKVKVKFSLEQATKAQRGSRCIALLFLQPRR